MGITCLLKIISSSHKCSLFRFIRRSFPSRIRGSEFLRSEKLPACRSSPPLHRRSFLMRGDFLTAALLRRRSFSTRPDMFAHVPPDRGVKSLGIGSELGWHSSMSMARSGVLFARHCSRMSACRCRLLMLCDENACASSDSDGLGDEVALRSDMLKSYMAGS